jgi:hypothetical protein
MVLKRRLACSFCKRSHRDVEKLVAGPGVFICDRCVAIAADLMREDYTPPSAPSIDRPGALARIASRIRGRFGSPPRRTAAPHAPVPVR